MLHFNYRNHLLKISDQILRLFPLIFILFGIFFIYRFIFFCAFSGPIDATFSDIAKGFLLGVRYDSATIIYGLSIPILLLFFGLFIPSSFYLFIITIFSKIWVTIILCVFLLFFGVDFYFYEFFQDHLNIIFFNIFEDDTKAVIYSIFKNYPAFWILLALLLFSIGLYKLLGRIFYENKKSLMSNNQSIGFIIFSFFIFIIMGRASFGMFPINMMDAAYTSNAFLNKLAPNPIFTFEKAIEARIEQKNAKPFWRIHNSNDDIKNALSITSKVFLGLGNDKDINSLDQFFRETQEKRILKSNPPHVIIVMMEGFGSWILDYDSEEFQISCGISNWIDSSLYFDHFIQSGFGSIQNLTSTVLSTPSIPNIIPISQQKYSVIPFQSALAKNFKEEGYETNFVYGGKLSWQRLGDFIPNQGFDNVYGEGDMPDDTPKTDWGVYDEYLFDFVYEKLLQSNSPQFILFFTTTNHPPFELPSDFNSPPLKISQSLQELIRGNEDLAQKRFSAYQYANCYLNQFLDNVYTNPILQNTITTVTADHNLQGIRNYYEKDLMHQFRVPFFILGPNKIIGEPRIISDFGSHVDISPTITELVLSKVKYLSFGKNLLSKVNRPIVNQNGIMFDLENVFYYNYLNLYDKGLYKWTDKSRWNLNRVENDEIKTNMLDLMTAYYSTTSYYYENEWVNYSRSLSFERE